MERNVVIFRSSLFEIDTEEPEDPKAPPSGRECIVFVGQELNAIPGCTVTDVPGWDSAGWFRDAAYAEARISFRLEWTGFTKPNLEVWSVRFWGRFSFFAGGRASNRRRAGELAGLLFERLRAVDHVFGALLISESEFDVAVASGKYPVGT
jgi:hypothetical protein